jgi:hypothetical protein
MPNIAKWKTEKWYDRQNWPYASDRQFVKDCALWIKEVDWKLFATLTFAWPISDERADKVFTAFRGTGKHSAQSGRSAPVHLSIEY